VPCPPVIVIEPVISPSSGSTPSSRARPTPTPFCTAASRLASPRTQHLRAADAQQPEARAEADGGEERDHERRLQRRVELEGETPAWRSASAAAANRKPPTPAPGC
jgi:hypothetical protein